MLKIDILFYIFAKISQMYRIKLDKIEVYVYNNKRIKTGGI